MLYEKFKKTLQLFLTGERILNDVGRVRGFQLLFDRYLLRKTFGTTQYIIIKYGFLGFPDLLKTETK